MKKPMQVGIDDTEVIPGVLKVTITYVEPDTNEKMGSTVEIIMHLRRVPHSEEKRTSAEYPCFPRDPGTYKEIAGEAVQEASRILRSILELD